MCIFIFRVNTLDTHCHDLEVYLRRLLRIDSLLDHSTVLQNFCGIYNGRVPPKDKYWKDRRQFNRLRSRLIVFYTNNTNADEDDESDGSRGEEDEEEVIVYNCMKGNDSMVVACI